MSRRIDRTMGEKTIGEIVTSFNFRQIDETNSSANDHLSVGLAPSYATSINSNVIERMDNNTKVAIAGVVKTLERIPREQRNFDAILSQFVSFPLLEPDTNIGTTRSDRIAVQSIQELRSSDMVNKAQSWFTSLIADHDVLNSTKIDTNVLSVIVDKAAGAASAFERNLREEWHDKTLLDIGVLRFPDPEKPLFQLYRIKLFAWATEHRFLGHNINGCGISGEYNSRIFKPRESVISGLRQEVMKRASEEAVSLFGPA